MEKPYRMDEHQDPPFDVGPRALEIYRERLGFKEGIHGEFESAVLQVAHYAWNAGAASLRAKLALAEKVVEAARNMLGSFMAINKKNGWGRVEIADVVKLDAALAALASGAGEGRKE